MLIKVTNWAKVQDRPFDDKRRNFSWFKFKNEMPMDEKILSLPLAGKWLWVLILCEANRKGVDVIEAAFTKWKAEGVPNPEENIKKLLEMGLVERLPGDSMLNTVRGEEKRVEERREDCVSNAPRLMEIWNEHRGNLPGCKGLVAKRAKAASLRWKENPDADYWTQVVKSIAASKFCNGDNERTWRAGFDFLIRPETHLKVLEGQYDGKKSSQKGPWNG